MLNLNPLLREHNPVLREASFHYVFKRDMLRLEDILISHTSYRGTEEVIDQLERKIENGLYYFLDIPMVSNILLAHMNRHGVHQVAEALYLAYLQTETNFAQYLVRQATKTSVVLS